MSRSSRIILVTFAIGIAVGIGLAEALRMREPEAPRIRGRSDPLEDSRGPRPSPSERGERRGETPSPAESPRATGTDTLSDARMSLLAAVYGEIPGPEADPFVPSIRRILADRRLAALETPFGVAGILYKGWLTGFPGLRMGIRLPPALRIEIELRRRGLSPDGSEIDPLVSWLSERELQRRRIENRFLEASWQVLKSDEGLPAVASSPPIAYALHDGRIAWLHAGDLPAFDSASEALEREVRSTESELHDRIRIAGRRPR